MPRVPEEETSLGRDPEMQGAREPLAFSPELHVRRIEEDLIRRKLLDIDQGGTWASVIQFIAPPGMGKTWLGEAIAFNCQDPEQIDKLSMPPLPIIVDLDRVESLEAITEQVRERIAADGLQESPAVEGLTGTLSALLETATPVLIFDNADYIARDLRRRLETEIETLVVEGKALFVFLSESERSSPRFEVKRRLDKNTYGLSGFSEEQIIEQLRKLIGQVGAFSEEEEETITYFAAGLPGALPVVAENLRENGGRYDSIVAERIYGGYIDPLLQGLTRETRKVVEVGAGARVLTPRKLGKLLGEGKDVIDPRVEAGCSLLLSNAAAETGMVQYQFDGRYRVWPEIGRLIDRNSYVRAQERYLQKHRWSVEYHEEVLNRYPAGFAEEAREILYHLTRLPSMTVTAGEFGRLLEVLRKADLSDEERRKLVLDFKSGLNQDAELVGILGESCVDSIHRRADEDLGLGGEEAEGGEDWSLWKRIANRLGTLW